MLLQYIHYLITSFKVVREGKSRVVILIGNVAIKIPYLTSSHSLLLYSMYTNYREYDLYNFNPTWLFDEDELDVMIKYLAPSLWCSWFGLIQIQRRVDPLLRDLTKEEKQLLNKYFNDIKKENCGLLNDQLVIVDYAD